MKTRWVWITSPSDASPVYHRLVDVEFHEPGGRDTAVMACGVRCNDQWWASYLRRRHADLFARPCRRCFTEVDS